jgi:hypothetical protein
MCVAILIKPGAAVNIDKIRRGAQANPDGSGYAFVRNGKVEIYRALKWEQIEKSFIRNMGLNGDSPFLVHHRIKSHGEVCKENCHPFRMADGGVLIHNGIIPVRDIPGNWSDTRHFTKNVIDKLPEGWADTALWQSMVAQMISSASKMCFLWPDGSWLILNESKGFWEDENGSRINVTAREEEDGRVWYSNQSCAIPFQSPGTATATAPHRYPTGTGSSAYSRPQPTASPPKQDANAVPLTKCGVTPIAIATGTIYSVTPLPDSTYVQVSTNRWRAKTDEERGFTTTPRLVVPEDATPTDFREVRDLLIEAGVCPFCERVCSNAGAVRTHLRYCDAATMMGDQADKAMVVAGPAGDEWSEDMFLGMSGL